GYVSPIDALLIINDLNSNGAHPVPSGIGGTGEPPSEMLDVNGDGLITPMDVLLIINHLNSRAAARAQLDSTSISSTDSEVSKAMISTPLESAYAGASAAPTGLDSAEERRQRENASIDAELEALLDQLSREQTKP
ncbi:MAG: hypothetical protein KDA51_05310, partial [Planctomycetales bacterium]|nr:hypothetical protein [Planctomycetales bacterium]